jgi:hypothetical protein
MMDELQPVWFRLPKRFYRKLSMVAESGELRPENALEAAVDLLGEIVMVAHSENMEVKDFITQMRPRVRAWRKEARNRGTSLIQAIEDGAKLYHLNGPLNPAKHSRKETIRNSPAGLAILRWANIPASERSEQARKLAQKRWATKREKRDRAVGEQPEK